MTGATTGVRARTVRVPGRGTFLVAEGIDADVLAEALRRHDGAPRDSVLKRAPDRVVTRISVPASPPGGDPGAVLDLVVKEHRVPPRWAITHFLGIPSRFARGLAVARRLQALGIATPSVLATSLRIRRSIEFLVATHVSGPSLMDILWRGRGRLRDPEALERLLARAGSWLRGLHDLGVWKRDMKSDNVILAGPTVEDAAFCLLDITEVRFLSSPVGTGRRARNLAQFLDLPERLETPARRALVGTYAAGLEPGARRRLEARLDASISAAREARRRLAGTVWIDQVLPPEGD